MARVTLQTVADKVGVSRMTVSNAFSRPDQLSAQMREKILSAAEELGYVGPDPAARALARGTTSTIGIVLTAVVEGAFSDEVATGFLGAIAAELAPTGLSLTLLSTQETAGRIPARDVPMDGALVYHCDPLSPALDWLQRRKLPLVYVDQIPEPGVPSVNVDDRGGARAAAQHLLDLGHRRIGIVTSGVPGPHGLQTQESTGPESNVTIERMRGWMSALEPAGVVPVVVKAEHSTEEEGYEALGMLLAAEPELTAVLCFADTLAHGVMLAAQNRGLQLPQDLSVVGFDDNPLAVRLQPALTTVRQDITLKGRIAAATLLRMIGNAGSDLAVTAAGELAVSPPDVATDDVEHVLLPATLIVRDSTAPVNT